MPDERPSSTPDAPAVAAQLARRLEEEGIEYVLSVFKMMFFREKDLGDVRQVLRVQADDLDRDWVRERLVEIFGTRDPRIPAWDDLVARTPPG